MERFTEDYVLKNLPLIVRDAARPDGGWPCVEKWSSRYLKEHVGHANIRVRAKPQQDGMFGDVGRLGEGCIHLYDFEEVNFGDFLESLDASSPAYYGARLQVQEDLPELVPDMPNFYELPWREAFGVPYKGGIIAYFGSGKQSTPLHYDPLENLIFMVQGSKTFLLFHPSDSANLYPSTTNVGTHYSLVPSHRLLSDQTDAEGFELVQNARCLRVTLRQGDMLYLPICWWHAVQGCEGSNVSLHYWFAQSRLKEDYDVYKSYLEVKFAHWVEQLETMDLPGGVMSEGRKEAKEMIEAKLKERQDFSWGS
ncbi:unnamed protein product [Ostreobium quekettii]|uniref:JmjC domain-containing protein n=1 Tax=Ostreobium quekettii TaxID=121088 RepID=A0A8S1IW82_9CHLO|nr:unnamed protein product [Ostreobium quekettii]|eukprot:evm.model.scf_339EXC.7 EVM.evm.TU.scf_339EXC.7   scf_339EXC:38319-41879(+)